MGRCIVVIVVVVVDIINILNCGVREKMRVFLVLLRTAKKKENHWVRTRNC